MGSRLIDLGLQPGTPPESWNITQPEKIKQIHLEYFSAGSDIVLTNTFGGSRLKLEAHGHGDKVKEYNTRAVEIAKEICPPNGYIAGDIGPSGKFLPPVGSITEQELIENFIEQTTILAEADVDLFFIETMVDLKEAEIAVKAAKRVSNIPIFASITYKKTKRGFFTIMGNSIEQCSEVLEEAGADAIGANCTISSEEMVDLIPLIANSTNLPIIAKPNAGQPQLIEGKTIYLSKPAEFTRDIQQMIKNGATIVGGCCGSNPKFIDEISNQIRGEKK
ncbi:MAG: homocysteine S-methyltransferase family protein [Candidatus Heimdallarchaeota archaeon]|nr:homocysteine S-methyltransferase family protein [Candidatus Heimdallarchaeota archaeon]MCK4254914.1 homocysteine S-methyltransferase family protein [Candidatus Heimdallarchaeota archaeon]